MGVEVVVVGWWWWGGGGGGNSEARWEYSEVGIVRRSEARWGWEYSEAR